MDIRTTSLLLYKAIFLFVLSFGASASAVLDSDTTGFIDSLSAKEKAWISAHPIIRVHNELDWPPFNYAENGKPKGFSIDFMDLIAQKTGPQS